MNSEKGPMAQARAMLRDGLPEIVAEHKRRLVHEETTNREFASLVAPAYKAAGIVNEAGEAKEPHEMTAEEIAKAIEALEQKALAGAKSVAALPRPKGNGAFD